MRVVIEGFLRRGDSEVPAGIEYIRKMEEALTFLLKVLIMSKKINEDSVRIVGRSEGKLILDCDEFGLKAVRACLIHLEERGVIEIGEIG